MGYPEDYDDTWNNLVDLNDGDEDAAEKDIDDIYTKDDDD